MHRPCLFTNPFSPIEPRRKRHHGHLWNAHKRHNHTEHLRCPRNFTNELDRITALNLGNNYLSCGICHIALLPLPTIRVDASAGNECHGLHLFDPHLGAGLGEALGP